MNVESVVSVIKGPVNIGPTVTIGGAASVLEQANSIASVAWKGAESKAYGPAPLELASPTAFFESNMNIISIISGFNPQPELNAVDAVSEAETILTQAAKPSIGRMEVCPVPDTSIATLVSLYSQPAAFGVAGPVSESHLNTPADESLVAPVQLHSGAGLKRAVTTQLATPIILQGRAEERFDKIVSEKKPIRKGKTGKAVVLEDVIRVFKYYLIKPVAVYELWRRRVVRKRELTSGQQEQIIIEEAIDQEGEASLEDHPSY